MVAKEGDFVEINTGSEKLKGVIMPSDKHKVVIKLDSGYNISFNRKKIKSVKFVKHLSKKVEKKERISKKRGLKNVVILHTGGTVASRVNYETGGVSAKFTPEEILEMFPEIKDIVNIESKLVRNMASENMRFAHYNILAKEIEKEVKKGIDGIIITHGTDTMHYTSAALSFILENLGIPVVLVGSQRSSDRGSSDAANNLINACNFIAKTDCFGVFICMHKSLDYNKSVILNGCKARKMHTSRRDAFKAINSKPIALIDNGKISLNIKLKDKPKDPLKLMLFKENLKIGVVKAHPQMFLEELKCYEKFDGLVLEGTGLGHMPIEKIDSFTNENKKIFDYLKRLANKISIVMSSQTIFGRINMNVYGPGRKLQEIGIIGNFSDMTSEIAFIKLGWLLSNYPKKEVGKLFCENLRGEINERISGDEFDVGF
jgi:glutamyl-tRNA(Gln) amidotransferase subunit D